MTVGRAGYRWGALVIVLGAVIGGILLAVGIGSAMHSLPAFTAEFDSSSAAAQVSAPAHWALYVRAHELSSGTCTVRGTSSSVSVTPASTRMEFTRNGGSWIWVASVDGTKPDTFVVTGPPGQYAVGEQPRIAGFAARIVGGVFGLIVPLLVGLAVGGALIVTTAARRVRAGSPLV